MFPKYAQISALLCAGLMFMQSVTLQAIPVIHNADFVNKDKLLEGWLQSAEQAEEIIIVNAENEKETVKLPAMTTVSLRPTQTVTSKEVKKGAKVQFQVIYDVRVRGKTVIPAGSFAQGYVTYAQRPKMWGKPGKIEITVESLSVEDKMITLFSQPYTEEGESRATTAWIFLGVSLVILWPCIFVPFIVKGKEAILTPYTTIDAHTTKTEVLPVVE